jgi:hypothetical protein
LGGLDVGGGPLPAPGAGCEFEPVAGAVLFRRQLPHGVHLAKQYRLNAAGIRVSYRLENGAEATRPIAMTIINELSPDYATLARHGRQALAFSGEGPCPVIRNEVSGAAVTICCSRPAQATWYEGLLAAELALQVDLTLAPQTAVTFSLELTPTV